jgi:hypothetical protein
MKLIDLNPEYRELEGVGRCLLFDNPLDGSRIAIPTDGKPWPYTGAKWTIINGDDFSKLSITPSVDVKGSWHGFVTDGEIR